MSQDFFFLNRAHQLARLCRRANSNCSIPSEKLRAKLPEELQRFYKLVDRICDGAGSDDDTDVDDSLRADMQAFEKMIVDLRFSSKPEFKQPSVSLIRAIFSDAEYFSGLKPLPQYTDSFAYELLFPSWLNLLTALMLPRADNGKPRLAGAQQGELFSFLSKLGAISETTEQQLTGFMTLLASRFDAPHCELLLQRLVDVVSRVGISIVDTIDRLDSTSRDAREFTKRLAAYLTVKHSSYQWPSSPDTRIATTRPPIRVLPAKLRERLDELEGSEDLWSEYFAIATPLRQLVESEQMLASEFSSLIEKYPQRAADLLTAITSSSGVLCDEGQACVAKLAAQRLRTDPTASLERVVCFARTMAVNLIGFSESTIAYFCRQFIDDEKNACLLLDCCSSPEKQQQMVSHLLKRAEKSDDDARFMNLLCCVTIVTPDAEVRNAKHALQAFDAVVSNRSIGSREYSDLVGDLQRNTNQALHYLACPIMAGAGKSDRLASLYLTLNEITEVFQSSGKVGNFSVVRAKYSAMASDG
ncbi:MAG: hypothetical protein R3C53_07530 [Pirellulaceae bacterium]